MIGWSGEGVDPPFAPSLRSALVHAPSSDWMTSWSSLSERILNMMEDTAGVPLVRSIAMYVMSRVWQWIRPSPPTLQKPHPPEFSLRCLYYHRLYSSSVLDVSEASFFENKIWTRVAGTQFHMFESGGEYSKTFRKRVFSTILSILLIK